MQISLIDTTLREGLQVPGGSLFIDEHGQQDYIQAVLDAEVIDRFELSMPWERLPHETWQLLTTTAVLDRAQIYVGPSHTFDILERPELSVLDGRMLLSTTLIHKDTEGINSLSTIACTIDEAALRVGVECVGSVSVDETIKILHLLAERDDVFAVALGDSNDLMSREWIYDFFARIDTYNFPFSLGFHLHNAPELDAYTKAKNIVQAAQAVDMEVIEFDVTLCGIGDRLGILALQDAVYLDCNSDRQQRVQNTFKGLALRLRALALDELSHGTDNGQSHFTEEGNLRIEYL